MRRASETDGVPDKNAAEQQSSDLAASDAQTAQADSVDQLGFELSASCEPGRRWGRYRILRLLGRGAFSHVFLARDESLHRDVALKLASSGTLLSPQGRSRFLLEAQAAARLNHPNIVPVFDSGRIGDTHYIAYWYCPGPNLKQWLASRAQPLPATTAAAIVRDLCDGVAHAHSRGVLHRDLKPSNILLDPVPESELPEKAAFPFVPKIADFGLARLPEEDTQQTTEGTILGTVDYMAPEQASGELDEISTATDVYGLGAVLYELLTLRPPFRRNPGETDMLSTLEQVRTVPPAPPRRLNPNIPKELEAICLKCLAKHSSDRYGTANELGEDLRRFLQGRPVEARPASTLKRLLLWTRRHPTLSAVSVLIAVAMLLLIAGLMFYSKQLADWNRQLYQANIEARQAQQRAEMAHRIAELSRQAMERQLYVSDMQLAAQARREQDLVETAHLLQRHQPKPGETDRRTLAWFLLRRVGRVGFVDLSTPGGALYTVSYSHDGRLFAFAGSKAVACIHSSVTGREVGRIPTGQREINALGFSPDDRFL
ncbi:MAG: serine/threonine protein kinase, partial [Planctomycetes bacterium]|nr:serine/threonine protein kinase [Planctomycetota bacterium]